MLRTSRIDTAPDATGVVSHAPYGLAASGHSTRHWRKTRLSSSLGMAATGLKLVVIIVGVLACIVLASSNARRPIICIVQVEGESMCPALRSNDQVLFVRGRWRIGSVVLADVGEDRPVIKRVVARRGGTVSLTGDNACLSQDYEVRAGDVSAVMVAKLPFSSPLLY